MGCYCIYSRCFDKLKQINDININDIENPSEIVRVTNGIEVLQSSSDNKIISLEKKVIENNNKKEIKNETKSKFMEEARIKNKKEDKNKSQEETQNNQKKQNINKNKEHFSSHKHLINKPILSFLENREKERKKKTSSLNKSNVL